MPYSLFLDESGELGSKVGSSNFFLITVLSTQNPKKLNNRLRKEKKRLYDMGWPRDVEIKGTSLFGIHRKRLISDELIKNRISNIQRIIGRILQGDTRVHYTIVGKAQMAAHLKAAPYGIAYNFYAGTLLVRAYPGHFSGPFNLIVDQRSKETHSHLPFNGYVHTRMITDCEHQGEFCIEHKESHEVLGLQAVDLICWGLFRYYEHNDNTFKKLIDPSVGYCDQWYPGK